MERIEWKFPASQEQEVMVPMKVAVGGMAVLVVSLTLFTLGLHLELRLLGLVLCLLVLVCVAAAVLLWATHRATNAKCYLDDRGVHMEPGFFLAWSQLRSFTLADWMVPGQRVINLRARNPLRSRMLRIDPDAIDERELLGFAEQRLGREATDPRGAGMSPIAWVFPVGLFSGVALIALTVHRSWLYFEIASAVALVSYLAGLGAAAWLKSEGSAGTRAFRSSAFVAAALAFLLVMTIGLAFADDWLAPVVEHPGLNVWMFIGFPMGFIISASHLPLRR